MAQQRVELADLLTAAGAALGTANERLRLVCSPALLSGYDINLCFNGRLRLTGGDIGFSGVAQPDARQQAAGGGAANTSVTVRVVAAPALWAAPAAQAGGENGRGEGGPVALRPGQGLSGAAPGLDTGGGTARRAPGPDGAGGTPGGGRA